jgi:hypothetical protein
MSKYLFYFQVQMFYLSIFTRKRKQDIYRVSGLEVYKNKCLCFST